MNILPVLDLLGRQAVHAIGGLRNDYQPLRSQGCRSSCPLEISRHIQQKYGCEDWYVADLDGIVHRRWNVDLLQQLTAQGLSLWIDPGIQVVEDLFCVGEGLTNSRCIIATEALRDQSVFDALTCMHDPQQLTFSLDLIDGELNAPAGAWGRMSLYEIVEHVASRGVQEILVLDLAYVGCERGLGTLELCRSLRLEFPGIRLLTGGGVRSLCELRQLEQAGVDAVLLGSCLHLGEFTPEMLKPYVRSACEMRTDSKISG